MNECQEFNLSDFMADSLCVNGNFTSPARPMFHHKDPYASLVEEDPLKVLGELNFGGPKEVPENSVGTPIQEFFKGVNVFITGGSGFFGKVLTEKLLRAVPHINHVYLLIRPKRGKTCAERFDILLEDKVYCRMKAEVPHYRTKITALAGNISEPDLGLRDEDRQLVLDTVHVVFHCAADVRFLEPLRKAVASNVLGSKHALDLAREMKHLKAYVHVSTAYSQCVNRVIEERVPNMNVNYKDILHFVESNSDTIIQDNLQKLLQGWPNTYTFSKALCEDMVQDKSQGLPICIFRPSIVLSTYKEPVRGWTDNVYGPLGLILGTALGIVHCLRMNETNTGDVVPVDYVINCMIAAAWRIGTQSDHDIKPVYNFASSLQNIVCWKQAFNTQLTVDIWPSSNAVWRKSLFMTENYLLDELGHIVLHKIPGVILDKLAVISGKKPRMGKIFKSIEAVKKILRFFLIRFWEIKNDNVLQLWSDLSEEDKKLFYFDVKDIDWKEYISVVWLGLRYYFMKESMDTIPAARRKQKWFRLAHTGLKLVCGFVILKLAVSVAHIIPY